MHRSKILLQEHDGAAYTIILFDLFFAKKSTSCDDFFSGLHSIYCNHCGSENQIKGNNFIICTDLEKQTKLPRYGVLEVSLKTTILQRPPHSSF